MLLLSMYIRERERERGASPPRNRRPMLFDTGPPPAVSGGREHCMKQESKQKKTRSLSLRLLFSAPTPPRPALRSKRRVCPPAERGRQTHSAAAGGCPPPIGPRTTPASPPSPPSPTRAPAHTHTHTSHHGRAQSAQPVLPPRLRPVQAAAREAGRPERAESEDDAADVDSVRHVRHVHEQGEGERGAGGRGGGKEGRRRAEIRAPACALPPPFAAAPRLHRRLRGLCSPHGGRRQRGGNNRLIFPPPPPLPPPGRAPSSTPRRRTWRASRTWASR